MGEHAILATPLLLAVFPILVAQEPRAESPVVIFPALFALIVAIVWRAFAESSGRLYFIAAFFALATEAAWSSRYLTPATLMPALITYVAFALLYLGVPMIARRRGSPLRPAAAPGIVLLLGLMLLSAFADQRVAVEGLWGLALLLAILNAALFIESASASLPVLSLAGSLISWIVLLGWWDQAAAAVEQGSAGIAGIDRRVDLNHAFDIAVGERGNPPPQAADDAGGERLVEAKRVADRKDLLADLQVL